MAILVAFGALAQLSTWLIGPAKALGVAAAQGDMPARWRSHNSFGSPVAVLVIQGILTSVFALMFVLIPSINSAYWILSALTTEVIIVMYVLMFAALIKLRYSQPDTPRAYTIPGGKVGVWIVVIVAIASLAFSFLIGLLPPAGTGSSTMTYMLGMLGATLVLSIGLPAGIYALRKPSWRAPDAAAYLEGTEGEQPAAEGGAS
jgi:amino acid transporter